MDKKKQRNLNITLIGLAVISIGMFGYANIYEPHFAVKETVNVYVATQDIPANIDLEASMFTPVKMEADSYLPGSVTNLNEVVGKQLKSPLSKGELLFTQRIDNEKHSDGPLIAELTIPTNIPLKHNDTIRVYVQYVDKDKKVTTEELFHAKKVISKDRINSLSASEKVEAVANSAVSSSNEGSKIYVRLTGKEVVEYLEASRTGTLYVVKIADVEDQSGIGEKRTTSEREVKDTDTKEISNETSSESVASYQVEPGDTIATIAQKFMTTEETIAELNDGETTFKVGTIINVPGN